MNLNRFPLRLMIRRRKVIVLCFCVAVFLSMAPSAIHAQTATLTEAALNPAPETERRFSTDPDPLQISEMRKGSYPGSEITIESTNIDGLYYKQYVVSYLSEGNKIYALMSVPVGEKPPQGWPVIVFNHGYIEPTVYRTTERYFAYVEALSLSGYIVFKPDYRAHGESEGERVIGGGYGTPGYTVDVLNAAASLKNYPDADPSRIGMWGHSMGGQIVLRAMVVDPSIRAGVIWAGVVCPYPDIIARWYRNGNRTGIPISAEAQNWRSDFSGWVDRTREKYGNETENPTFWASISPNTCLNELSGPIQLHHAREDAVVPLLWSEILAGEFQALGDPYEMFIYENDDHNISLNFSIAMRRTIDFFDHHVKYAP